MDDEQGPWWTRPPEPARPEPVHPEPARLEHPGLRLDRPDHTERSDDLDGSPDPAAELGSDDASDPASDVPADPLADPAAEPVLEQTAEPVLEQTAEPVLEPAAEPVQEPAVKPKAPAPVIRRVGIIPDPPKPARPRWIVNPDVELQAGPGAGGARARAGGGSGGSSGGGSGSGSGDARTETLPSIPDDIFATFSSAAPDGLITGPIPAQALRHDPLAHLREDVQQDRPGRRHVTMRIDRRMVLIGTAGLLVVLIIALLAIFTGGRSGGAAARTPGPGSTPTAKTVAKKAAGTGFEGKTPTGLAQVGSGKAAQILIDAGQKGNGTVVEAWTWKDKNGSNLVVSTAEVRPGNHMSLKVIHLAHVETNAPKVLRVLKEPTLPECAAGGSAGFTKNSLLVRDLNSDGVAEIAAGWWSRCGQAKDSEVKLALITNGDKFIIRGDGVIGGSSGSEDPDPAPAGWPSGYLPALRALFHRLYY